MPLVSWGTLAPHWGLDWAPRGRVPGAGSSVSVLVTRLPAHIPLAKSGREGTELYKSRVPGGAMGEVMSKLPQWSWGVGGGGFVLPAVSDKFHVCSLF